jgi:tape measure domain-containing protein
LDIAKYFVTLGFKVDKTQTDKVDKTLKNFEAGLKKGTLATDKAVVSEKAVAKAKKSTAKVVDEQTLALKKAAEAEKDWIRRAKEGQRVSNATFRARMSARKAEQSAMRMQHTEALRMNREFNKSRTSAGMVRKGPVKIVSGGGSTRMPMGSLASRLAHLDQNVGDSSAAIGRMRSYYQQQERMAIASARKQDAAITMGAKKLADDEKRRTLEIAALRKQKLQELKQMRREEDDLARRNHQAELARIRAEREASRAAAMQRRLETRNNELARRNSVVGSRQGISGRSAIGAGVAGGLTSRMYGPAIGLAMGGYGLGQVMKANEAVVAARLQTQAVSQAYGGTAQQGNENFEWLKGQANRVGFSWIDTVGDFNTLTSNLVGAGQTTEDARTVFKGFAEYGRVNKLSDARQQLVFSALGQVAGKDKLQAEELTKQLGNSLPGAKSIFAEAWQRKTGGRLKGAESIQALEKAMKEGNVRGDILTIAAQIASEMAAPGLSTASKASQAERNRFKNQRMASYEIAAEAGVEGGFARTFKTLSITLKESDGLVASMARGFERATIEASKLLLFPQSFARALEGRDSLVADWLGADATAQLKADWAAIRESMEAMSNMATPAWLPTLEGVSRDIAAQMRVIAAIISGDMSSVGSALVEFAKGRYAKLGSAVATGPNFALRAIGTVGGFEVPQIGSDWYIPPSVADSAVAGYGLGSPVVSRDTLTGQNYQGSDPFSAAKNARELSYNSFGMPQASLDMKVDVTITAANPEDFKHQFDSSLKTSMTDIWRETMTPFSNKEAH